MRIGKKPSIIAFADLHLSNSGPGLIDRVGRNSFLAVRKRVFMEAIELARKHRAILLSLGDLLDKTQLDPVTAEVFHECLAKIMEYGIRFINIGGNHVMDGIDSLTGSYSKLALDDMHFVSTPKTIRFSSFEFYCVPYMGNDYSVMTETIRKFIRSASRSSISKKFLLFHAPVTRCRYDNGAVNGAGLNLAAIIKQHGNPFAQIWAGDFHTRQRLPTVKNFLYLGQPYWGDFSSEDQQRGLTLYYSSNSSRRLLQMKWAPQFMSVYGVSGLASLEELELNNKIVRLYFEPGADRDAIRKRCKALGAIRTFSSTMSAQEDDSFQDVEYKYSEDRRDVITKYSVEVASSGNPKLPKDSAALMKHGLDIYDSVIAKSGSAINA